VRRAVSFLAITDSGATNFPEKVQAQQAISPFTVH